jgi:hypothetical protein
MAPFDSKFAGLGRDKPAGAGGRLGRAQPTTGLPINPRAAAPVIAGSMSRQLPRVEAVATAAGSLTLLTVQLYHRRMRRHRKSPRRRDPDKPGPSLSPLPGLVLRDGPIGYYPCTVVIAGVTYPCAVLEMQIAYGAQVARVRYAGPDGEDRLTTVEADMVTLAC